MIPASGSLPAASVKQAARTAGFDLCGLARAGPLDPAPLRRWLDLGYEADMAWMRRRVDERLDPRKIMAGATTVVALACAYLRPDEEALGSAVARYARGDDYHAIVRGRLRALRRGLLALDSRIETHACVDAGVVMEKAWAERAGLGRIGKNGCLAHPELGSWLVLAAMVIDRAVDTYDEPCADLCGGCSACLEACPTSAIPAPGVVDAQRCLAYYSVENRGFVPEDLRGAFAGRVFGCDICQEVCPHNRPKRDGAPVVAATAEPGRDSFAARPIARRTVAQLAELSREEFHSLSRGSAVARAGYDGIRRNALYALGSSPDLRAMETARRLTRDQSPVVRDAATWAVSRLSTSSNVRG